VRLKTFSLETRPLLRDLRPVARDLRPTLRDLRLLAPDLEAFFSDLDPLITASDTGQLAAREILRGSCPSSTRCIPSWASSTRCWSTSSTRSRRCRTSSPTGPPGWRTTTKSSSGGTGHYLRQIGVGAESVAMYRERIADDRGNTHLRPKDLVPAPGRERFPIFGNFDCRTTQSGGEQEQKGSEVACFVSNREEFRGRLQERFPHVEPNGYGGR